MSMTLAAPAPTPKMDAELPNRSDVNDVPTPAIPRVHSPFAVQLTRDDCERLEQLGRLDFRYELVEGEIIRRTQLLPHNTSTMRVVAWLLTLFVVDLIHSQAAIDVLPEDNPTSRPEPDAAVLDTPVTTLMQQNVRHPRAANVRLLIEVSDATLTFDLTTKAGLYARAGIAEYWVVNVAERRLHVRRRPVGGRYQDESNYAETDAVACLAAPDAPVLVSSLLP